METTNIKKIQSECIVLLHGMGRTKFSMRRVEKHFIEKGYEVFNADYPSTKLEIEELSNGFLSDLVSKLKKQPIKKLHFVTHSLGGIILRHYLQKNSLPDGSRVVMLAPPNKGSEVADFLKNNFLYKFSTGKAGQRLTTDKDSLPNNLKEIDCDVGIIAGSKSMEPWFSFLIHGLNDGKVSVENTKLLEMKDFISMPFSHTFIMDSKDVILQVEYFIKNGTFKS